MEEMVRFELTVQISLHVPVAGECYKPAQPHFLIPILDHLPLLCILCFILDL